MAKKFAVFDIDGTLIRWQLFHAIVHHLGKHGYIDEASHKAISAARMNWKKRDSATAFGDYEHLLVKTYKQSLATINPDDYAEIVDEVFNEYKDQLFVYTRDLLAELKAKNYMLFAVSGSQDEIVQKLAKYYGFDAAIGAKLIMKNGRYTGVIDTPVLAKDKAVQTLISKHDVTIEGSIGVGDTASDIAMLEIVNNPIVFNPTKELFQIATTRKWPIVVERKNVVYHLSSNDGQYTLG
jgi:HAD superfamily hydrolase (TIGR01490 family)